MVKAYYKVPNTLRNLRLFSTQKWFPSKKSKPKLSSFIPIPSNLSITPWEISLNHKIILSRACFSGSPQLQERTPSEQHDEEHLPQPGPAYLDRWTYVSCGALPLAHYRGFSRGQEHLPILILLLGTATDPSGDSSRVSSLESLPRELPSPNQDSCVLPSYILHPEPSQHTLLPRPSHFLPPVSFAKSKDCSFCRAQDLVDSRPLINIHIIYQTQRLQFPCWCKWGRFPLQTQSY